MILDSMLIIMAKVAIKRLTKDLRKSVKNKVKDEDKKKVILSKIDLAEFAIRKRDFGMANIILEDLKQIAIEIKSSEQEECSVENEKKYDHV